MSEKNTDADRLNWILKHWHIDEVDSFEKPLDPEPSPENLMVFDMYSGLLKLKPRHLDEDLRETIDRAMEEGE